VLDKKKIIEKMEGPGRGDEIGVASLTPSPQKKG
jgi:hypothetical protein